VASAGDRAGDRNALHHTRKMQQRFKEMIDHLRQDIDKVDEPEKMKPSGAARLERPRNGQISRCLSLRPDPQ
jgi:hypothetical protein